MMKDQFANYVVQRILETSNDKQREVLLNRIRIHLHALKKYTYGKHIVARFEQLSGEGAWISFSIQLPFITCNLLALTIVFHFSSIGSKGVKMKRQDNTPRKFSVIGRRDKGINRREQEYPGPSFPPLQLSYLN